MKNFTKQNFKTNPLWIRLLIMTFMLLIGTGSAWAFNLSGSMYFDNSETKWTSCYMYIGHNSYGRAYTMSLVSGTRYLWKYTNDGTWSGATAWYVSSEQWGDWTGGKGESVTGKACWHTENTFTHPYTSAYGANVYKATGKSTYSSSECSKSAYNWSSTKPAYSTTYTITLNIVGSGSVTIKNNAGTALISNATANTSKTGVTYLTYLKNITATPSSGYALSSIKIGSTDYTSAYKSGSDTDNGYDLTGNVTITVTFEKTCTPPAAPTFNPNSTTVCSGTSFNLPSGYRWYTAQTGGTKLSSNTISAGVTAKTIYYAEAGEDGCVSTSRTAYTVNVDPKSALTLKANPTICQGSSIVLSDYVESSTGTVKWYSNSGRTTEITNPSVARTPQSNPTYYYARATSGVCSSVDKTLTVALSPQPDITLKAAPTICEGEKVTFSEYVNSKTGTVTWHTDANCTSAAITTATPNQTTTYYAKATSGDCTPAKASLKVTVNNKPAVPTLSADKTSLVSPDKATLTAGNTTNGLTYTLYNGETPGESQKSTGGTLTFKVGEAGNYTVRVSNNCGTSTSTVVTITVCTPQTNEFRHANSSYNQLANQPTYYPGDKAYFVSTGNCCLTGTWSANLQKGEEGWWAGLTGSTPKFSMTLTRAGEFTITNMATNGCTQDKNVRVDLDFTVTALSQVTNANGTASGADIALTWKHSANHTKVMVVRYPTAGTETIPAGGQSYSAGNTLGEGTVVYVGTSESYTDKNLPSGESYKYYFYTVNNNYYSDGVVLNMSSCPIPAKPSLSSTAITACNGECTAQGYITINNMNDYKDDTYTFKLGSSVVSPDANGRLGINSTAYTQYTVTVTNSCGNPNSATVDIAINDNAPVITGNTSFQPNGSTTLTSDKGASTTWVALDGGDLNTRTGASVVFTAKENGTYRVQATYNGCTTTITIKVQDDLYVWVRRPIKKETAYDQFYHKDQNSDASKGGDLFYKEFASLPGDYQQYNQGGKAAEKTCTDKDGYKWYGFVVSKTAIENDYYFTVHAPNDKGYGGYHTHTYATQLVDMDADLYFVMDETPSNVNRGWNINTPVVVRASGDAMFNGNNFADFVPLYVKDANICGKEVISFEWQKSASQNGTYTTYKSGKGINNIRTREAGWYRCVVTYGDGKGTATSNAIQVTNTAGTSYSFTSNLPIVMVNTNGVGFPDECTVTGGKYPSAVADKMKEKISVDVIIKKGDQVLYDKKARMNYRGSSSLNFKKKSYAFVSGQDSCVFDKSRHDYVKTKKAKMLNILGLDYEANDKDWVMYAATADPSMIRNRLVFDLYQKMRPNDWGVHSTYVELVVDGEYKGVYVFMDKITANEKRVNIVDGTGFIVKFDKTDIADRYVDGNDEESDEKTFATSRTGKKGISTYGTTVDQLFEIEYPEKEDIVDAGGSWSATVETIKQRFEDFETALEAKNYEQVRAIIDYDSWADWFILNEFTKNLDAYRASCIFTCKGQGYKIQAVPLWDQELSFNNAAANISGKGANNTSGLLIQNSGVYGDAFPAPFWFTGGGTSITGGLLNDPCFISLVKEKWATYTADGGVLTYTKVNAMVDAYKADLGAIGTNTTPIYRENQMIPFNNNTNAGRGATSSCTGSQAIGYFGYGDNCGSPVSHDNSITAIKNWIPARITGLTSALKPLEGEALIFLVSPATQDVTPWQTALVSVQAPSGYTYDIDYSAITAAGGEVTVNNNTYSIKLPRPDGWAIGGNGDDELSLPYEISASIEIEDEGNTCGVSSPGGEDTKTATIVLKDEIENCTTPVTK